MAFEKKEKYEKREREGKREFEKVSGREGDRIITRGFFTVSVYKYILMPC